MTLDADHVLERRGYKRRLAFWRVTAVVALVLAVAAAVGRFQGGGDYVSRLDVDGIILSDRNRDMALADLALDEGAKALIVRINSPGGTVVGGEILYRNLRAVAEKKPVVAVMGATATSAGYMAAIGADHIVANPGSLTGSIGVLLQTADVTGLLEKLGVKAETIKSRPLKAQPNPLEPFTPEARAAIRSVVLDLYAMFVDMVSERRAMPRDKTLGLADGRVFTGRQALANGLIDALGSEAEARDWLAETHKVPRSLPVKDLKIAHEGEPWRDFLGSVFGKTLLSERLRLDGLISLWQPDL